MPSTDDSGRLPRRRVLRFGAGALAAGLAGCTDTDGATPTDSKSPSGSEPPPSDTDSPRPPGESGPLDGPWPTVHADSANTGRIDASGPQGTPSVRWRAHVDTETDLRVTDGPEGSVATQADGTVLALDHTGSVRWRRQLSSDFAAAPVVESEGTVVVGARDGTVVAFESDGTERWRKETPEGLFAPHLNDATPFRIVDDTVILAHPRGQAFAFALGDGTVRWTSSIPPRTHRPAAANGRIFLASGRPASGDGSVVLALDAADGTDVWRRELDGSISIGVGLRDATVYTADIDGRIRALAADDGADRWQVRLPEDPWISTIPKAFAGRIWVGTLSEGLFAVTEAGVQQRVSVPSPTTPAVGDGRLYVGTAEFGRGDDSDDGDDGDDGGSGDGSDDSAGGGAVIALDGDGTVRWRTRTRGFPESQVRYRDGTVFVGTTSGVVAGFASGDGSRRWRTFERPAELPTPVVGSASVYCGARDNWLGGYRATDGTSHLWTVSYERAVPGTPAVTADGVIGGSLSGEVALTPPSEFVDPPTGRLTRTATPDPDATPTPHVDAPSPEPTWRIDLDGPVEDVGYGDAGPYLGSGSEVVALRSTGDVRWRVGVGGPVRSAPAVGDDTVYATTTDGAVAALAPGDGTKRWRKSISERATAPVFADCGDTNLLLVGTESALVALAPNDGTEQWRVETAGLRGSPAVTEQTAVVGDTTGVIRGIALPDGTEQWRHEADGAVHGSPAIADGVAYVGTRARRLLALAVDDGSVRWKIRLADWIDSSPVVGHGAVFAVDQSGTLSAVVGDE